MQLFNVYETSGYAEDDEYIGTVAGKDEADAEAYVRRMRGDASCGMEYEARAVVIL